ncbi:enoyl-CoA hydratase [Thalassotalea insulae]|uniref:3-hydroxyisobutyryl-CoA hydrolase n=1 Tax=Thalassotalea insulae TaxID=2056778 RepID=A0ABQ6GZ66_9GAMM|nr:enoyl-CoA hydratase/isomerase family protein [Thalassotalea insulae]GLX79877.1 enoyl-CoA hydratase [Thalassotalea insulae]
MSDQSIASATAVNNAAVLFTEQVTANNKILAFACLNSAKTLNALTLEMIELLLEQLSDWLVRPEVVAIVIHGAGDKAFCAGGDVVSIYHDIQGIRNNDTLALLTESQVDNSLAKRFFSAEYQLDLLIHQATKPIISLLKGYTLGGGVGLMAGASHRVACDNSLLAMPEISIGLYPDVGASWFFNQMPQGIAKFLALTGVFINAQDGLDIKLIDYAIDKEGFELLATQLTALSWQEHEQDNHQLLSEFFIELQNIYPYKGQGNITQHSTLFEQLSGSDNLASCYHVINEYPSQDKWLLQARKKLTAGSPLSAFVIFEQLKRCRELSLVDCFSQELKLSLRFCQHSEFVEGVRALLVDKDNKPDWQYKKISEVEKSQIAWFFS